MVDRSALGVALRNSRPGRSWIATDQQSPLGSKLLRAGSPILSLPLSKTGGSSVYLSDGRSRHRKQSGNTWKNMTITIERKGGSGSIKP